MDKINVILFFISLALLWQEFDIKDFKRFLRIAVIYWVALLYGILLGF